mmetsp:Transcript_20150/g.50722  ORF Transcript_20150/g.50722 Transcript_20150/m.50722 type:complete len:293 (-) Transcript_20150:28-906(-)
MPSATRVLKSSDSTAACRPFSSLRLPSAGLLCRVRLPAGDFPRFAAAATKRADALPRRPPSCRPRTGATDTASLLCRSALLRAPAPRDPGPAGQTPGGPRRHAGDRERGPGPSAGLVARGVLLEEAPRSTPAGLLTPVARDVALAAGGIVVGRCALKSRGSNKACERRHGGKWRTGGSHTLRGWCPPRCAVNPFSRRMPPTKKSAAPTGAQLVDSYPSPARPWSAGCRAAAQRDESQLFPRRGARSYPYSLCWTTGEGFGADEYIRFWMSTVNSSETIRAGFGATHGNFAAG